MEPTVNLVRQAAAQTTINFADPNHTDGRTVSNIKERPYLVELEIQLKIIDPETVFILGPNRHWFDFMVNNVPFNLKLTQGNSADNAWNKTSVAFTFTGQTINQGNMNHLMENLIGNSKNERNRTTEYYYLVVNKNNGISICKSLLDIHTYHSNPSNIMQINWGHEFEHADYVCEDHREKMRELLTIARVSITQRQQGETSLFNWQGVL